MSNMLFILGLNIQNIFFLDNFMRNLPESGEQVNLLKLILISDQFWSEYITEISLRQVNS